MCARAHGRVRRHESGFLRKRGFKFVGSTICYAMMQAVGMANDHLISCFRHSQVGREKSGLKGICCSFGRIV